LLFDQQMSVRKTVDIFRAVSFGNAFGIDSDKVVRLEAIDGFDLGKKPAVVLVEQACEEQIPRRLDIVFRFVGMVDLVKKHAEDMVVCYVFDHVRKNSFKCFWHLPNADIFITDLRLFYFIFHSWISSSATNTIFKLLSLYLVKSSSKVIRIAFS